MATLFDIFTKFGKRINIYITQTVRLKTTFPIKYFEMYKNSIIKILFLYWHFELDLKMYSALIVVYQKDIVKSWDKKQNSFIFILLYILPTSFKATQSCMNS